MVHAKFSGFVFRRGDVIGFVQKAIRDHKRAGNPIAELRDGRVVLVPSDQIED
jgi:hypothetical protein